MKLEARRVTMASTAKKERAGIAAIDVMGLSKHFGVGDGKVVALNRVSVIIRENEFFTLLGPSGCGKTTLLRMIAGFDYQDEGEILLYGEDIAGLPPFRRPINTVFQSYALFPHMTVSENIGFGLKMQGWAKPEIAARVTEMLKLVQMEELKGRRISQISGGQQQRVALARALAPRPKVLLLDEPLSALDYKLRKEMQIELKRLQHETGITFIFVTHDQEEALTMSDRIAVMDRGIVLQIGSPREIYHRPADRFVASFIGESNFLTCIVRKNARGTLEARLRDGSIISVERPEGFEPSSEATIAVRPEHAFISEKRHPGELAATIENMVFLGTDTHVYTRLSDGTLFVVRQQNLTSDTRLESGQHVGIQLLAGAARLLRN
jgi:spermidine/putrescine transport system ATP-binding protein